MRAKKNIARAIRILILIVLVVWSVFPIYWNILTSLKERTEIFSFTPKFWVTSPNWSAYETALTPGSASIYKYITNSLTIAIGATVLTLLFGIMAAYSFSRNHFRGKGLLWLLVLATRLLPPISTIVPLFLMASKLNLVDTHILLICVDVALNIPFSIWMLRSFFDSVPLEVQEASIVDGCSTLQSVVHIMLPLAAPGIVTVAMFVFVQVWNEYTFSFIFSATKTTTLPVIIAQAQGEDVFMWQDMAARTSIQMIPVLFLGLYLQKHLVGGLTAGAVKG